MRPRTLLGTLIAIVIAVVATDFYIVSTMPPGPSREHIAVIAGAIAGGIAGFFFAPEK